jgi:hypothetical protein
MKRIIFFTAVALFALAGAAYGGSKITGAQIKDGTVTTKDIKNGTLTESDVSDKLWENMQGEPGLQGPQGPPGPPGPVNAAALVPVSSAQVAFGSSVVQSAVARCSPGYRVISGGGASVSDEQLAISGPLSDRTGWLVAGVDFEFNGGEYVQAFALCGPANTATLASTDRTRREVAAAVARVKAAQPRSERR